MKLLNLTTRHYGIYFGLILLASVPVFYLAIQRLFVKEVDESLRLRKHKLEKYLNAQPKRSDLHRWEDLDGDIRVMPASRAPYPDRLYQRELYDSLAGEMEPYRELASFITVHQKSYQVFIRTSLLESFDLIYGIVEVQATLVVLLLLGMLLLNRRIARRIWQPFYQTVDQLNAFTIDSPGTIPLPDSVIDEFSDLNRAIRQLALKNRTVFQSQKEFTENAAHELQTPIAILQGKLEILLQNSEFDEARAIQIGSALDVLDRMNKLVKSLLLLAKIDNNQFGRAETVDISNSLVRLMQQYYESITAKQLMTDIQVEPLSLHANATLVEILLTNLLSNAIRHSVQQGALGIQLVGRRLVITNTGKSARLLPEQVFERFQKDPSNPQSTGLGLAIVKKIADLNGWTIAYSVIETRHTIRIDF